ncbi:MAG: hypothetical protein ACRDL2_02720 [Gaiellaceae bacterium]
MRGLSFLRSGVPVERLAAYGRDGTDAYDLVDRLPCGPQRAAAWNAYVCQTYADKLVDATRASRFAPFDTARLARGLYALVGVWLERAQGTPSSVELALPPWYAAPRRREQLVGMRETLYALRTHVAYDLAPGLQDRLAAIDRRIGQVDALWIDRPSPELAAGICDLLAAGIRDACTLGRELALGPDSA